MARQDESFTSIGDRRQAEFLIYFLGVPMGPVTPDQMASHAEGVFQAIEPWVLSRGPLNFLGERDVSASHVRSIYGDSDYERLLKTKETYDPGNLFRFAGVGLSD